MSERGDGPVLPDAPRVSDAPDAPDPTQVITSRPAGGRTALVIATVVGLVVAMLVVLLVTRDPAESSVGRSRLLDKVAPPVAGTTLDGGTVDIDDLRGRWVVVNFMASWCVPCRTEHPELLAFHEAHRERGDAVLVGVTFGDRPDDAREFFREREGGWPVISDPTDAIGVAYGVLKPPETYLIDPAGVIVERWTGAIEQRDLDAAIAFYGGGVR